MDIPFRSTLLPPTGADSRKRESDLPARRFPPICASEKTFVNLLKGVLCSGKSGKKSGKHYSDGIAGRLCLYACVRCRDDDGSDRPNGGDLARLA